MKKFKNKDTEKLQTLPRGGKPPRNLSFEITTTNISPDGPEQMGLEIYTKELFIKYAIDRKRQEKGHGDNQTKELYYIMKNKLDTYSLTQLYRLAIGS